MTEAVDKNARKTDLLKTKGYRVILHYFADWNGKEEA
jgi:hypothetical protein